MVLLAQNCQIFFRILPPKNRNKPFAVVQMMHLQVLLCITHGTLSAMYPKRFFSLLFPERRAVVLPHILLRDTSSQKLLKPIKYKEDKKNGDEALIHSRHDSAHSNDSHASPSLSPSSPWTSLPL